MSEITSGYVGFQWQLDDLHLGIDATEENLEKVFGIVEVFGSETSITTVLAWVLDSTDQDVLQAVQAFLRETNSHVVINLVESLEVPVDGWPA